ncbi:MAG: multicomponent K+:H+ antiporter subunit F, partial [Colwellia sp.]
MLETVILIVFTMIGLSLLLNVWRLLIGPSVPDRILALDTMYINTIALIILYG